MVVDNYSNSSPEALKRVKELTGKDFPIYEADVCDSEAMNALFDREKIERSSTSRATRRWANPCRSR